MFCPLWQWLPTQFIDPNFFKIAHKASIRQIISRHIHLFVHVPNYRNLFYNNYSYKFFSMPPKKVKEPVLEGEDPKASKEQDASKGGGEKFGC